MSEDRSLSEFTGGDAEAAGEPDAEDGTGDANADGDAVADVDGAETVSPTTITAEWTPDGADCENCGETVERRWRDGEADDDADRLVCADCKTW